MPAAEDKPSREGVKSAHRTLSILELLVQSGRPLTFAEIATALDYPRSSLFGLLNTLQDRKWIDLDEQSRAYRLGIRVFEGGSAYQRSLHLLTIAQPSMERIRDALNETVQVSVLEGRYNIYLGKVDGGQQLRLASEVGRRLEAQATALGKMLLADLRADELDLLFDGVEFTAFTAQSISSLTELKQELARIRRQGYAEDHEEYTTGVRCVAMAVRDHTGRTVAALSVSFPTVRFSEERGTEARRLLGEAVAGISTTLGYRVSPHP